MFAAGALWGLDIGDDVAFFLVTAALALIGAFLVSRRQVWLRIVGMVFGLLVAMALFWTAFGLFSPASVFDFLPGVLVIPGVLLAIGATIASIVSGRRQAATTPEGTALASTIEPADGERRGIVIAIGVVVVLAALSAVLTATGQETVDDPSAAAATVVFSDFEFDEDGYEVPGGAQVFVDNHDPFLHTFQIDSLDVDVNLNPGSEKLVTIPDEPGDYIVYCEPHTSDPDDPSEDDMAARITVT
jgi:plastocyanin